MEYNSKWWVNRPGDGSTISFLEFEAKRLLGGLIHRRGSEEDPAPRRQDVARTERLPSQSVTGEMEELADELDFHLFGSKLRNPSGQRREKFSSRLIISNIGTIV